MARRKRSPRRDSMKIRKAVIPAGGLGTRFLPATKAQPKEMLPIVDKPTIQFIVEEAVASGIEDIIIITNHTKKAIEDHFDRSLELESELDKKRNHDLLQTVRAISNLANIYYIRQKGALGLGHAIGCARTFIGKEPFAVLLGDDVVSGEEPALKQLIDIYQRTGHSVLGVQGVPNADVNKYGIIAPEQPFRDRVCRVRDLIEKPSEQEAPSNIAIMGRYVLTPAIFHLIEQQEPGRGGEIQLTDALHALLQIEPIYACQFSGRRYDVGDKVGYLAATVETALAHPQISEQTLNYLAKLALDKNQPLHGAIARMVKERMAEK